MKNKKIIKSLALVALASTFAIAIAADSNDYSISGHAYADGSGADTSIMCIFSTRESTYCTSSAAIGNMLDWKHDDDSGYGSSSASVSASSLPEYGGSVQSSRAVSNCNSETYEKYWSSK